MKGQGLKCCVVAFLVLLLAGACVPVSTPAPTPVPPTPSPGPVDMVMAFQDALNRGAVDEAAALFHDDKVGIAIRCLEYDPGVKDALEWLTAQRINLELSDCKLEATTVNCQMLARDDACFKSIGLDPAHYPTARFKFLDGKINLVTADMVAEEASRVNAAFNQLDPWARLHLPDEVKKLSNPASTGTTPRQEGELRSKVCKAWAAANK